MCRTSSARSKTPSSPKTGSVHYSCRTPPCSSPACSCARNEPLEQRLEVDGGARGRPRGRSACVGGSRNGSVACASVRTASPTRTVRDPPKESFPARPGKLANVPLGESLRLRTPDPEHLGGQAGEVSRFVVVLGRVHLRPPLPGRRLSALATGRLLLRRRPALGRVAAGARLLAAVCRRLRRVGDLGRALLRHALVPQCFVLTFVLHARSLVRHRSRLLPSVVWESAARDRSAHRPPPACGSGTGPGIGSGFGAGGTGLGWGSGLGSGTRTRRHLPP